MPTIKEMPEARLVPSKAKEVSAPVIPADEAFGNSIMSMRDEADATGSRLHNALVNCEATYNRELTRINAAYQAERTSTIFGDNLNRSPYKDFLVSAKIGMGSLIKTGKLGINIEPQIRWYLQKVYRGNFVENPVHFGIQLSLLKL